MKTSLTWISFVLLLIVIGCGYNPEEAVYDTKANPNEYPGAALAVLDGIENGKLESMDAIAGAFGDLYSSHPDLLDNDDWNDVIKRLGSKFRLIADRHAGQGLPGYTRAAEYYQLAAFARPEERKLQSQAALFGVWLTAVNGEDRDLASGILDEVLTLPKLLAVTRRFVLSDTLDRQFFELHLREPLRQKVIQHHLLNDGALADMDAADRALVIMAGLADARLTSKVARFMEPAVDLAAYRLKNLDSLMVFEMYFVPRESVTTEIVTISRMLSPVAGRPAPIEIQVENHLKHRRGVTVGRWRLDEITAVLDTVSSALEDSWPSVGLAVRSADGWSWLTLKEKGGQMLRLEPPKSELQSVDSVASH